MLAVVGIACGLGIITAETGSLIMGVAALGLGGVITGVDLNKAMHGQGSWVDVGLGVAGDIAGVAEVTVAIGIARAAIWAFAGARDARASLRLDAAAQVGATWRVACAH